VQPETKEAVKAQSKRFGAWWTISVAAFAWVMWSSPENGSVLVYKLCMVTVGLLLGYWADRALMRNAPEIENEMPRDIVGAARILARAIIAYAVINGLTGGI
jgi:hypothetical protein